MTQELHEKGLQAMEDGMSKRLAYVRKDRRTEGNAGIKFGNTGDISVSDHFQARTGSKRQRLSTTPSRQSKLETGGDH